MPITHTDVETLIQRLEALQHTTIMIRQSITSDWSRGFDHHCTTESRFFMVLRSLSVTMSGANLVMHDGNHTWYAIALPKVSAFKSDDDGGIAIIERLAETVARRTSIS
jgi:hypothetical protein